MRHETFSVLNSLIWRTAYINFIASNCVENRGASCQQRKHSVEIEFQTCISVLTRTNTARKQFVSRLRHDRSVEWRAHPNSIQTLENESYSEKNENMSPKYFNMNAAIQQHMEIKCLIAKRNCAREELAMTNQIAMCVCACVSWRSMHRWEQHKAMHKDCY